MTGCACNQPPIFAEGTSVEHASLYDGPLGSEEIFLALLLDATGGQPADEVLLYE